MRKGRKFKDPWEGLDNELRAAIDSGDECYILKKISDWAMQEAAVREAMKKDQDLKAKKDLVKEASAGYKEVFKSCSLGIRYARAVLQSRGKDVPDSDSCLKENIN